MALSSRLVFRWGILGSKIRKVYDRRENPGAYFDLDLCPIRQAKLYQFAREAAEWPLFYGDTSANAKTFQVYHLREGENHVDDALTFLWFEESDFLLSCQGIYCQSQETKNLWDIGLHLFPGRVLVTDSEKEVVGEKLCRHQRRPTPGTTHDRTVRYEQPRDIPAGYVVP